MACELILMQHGQSAWHVEGRCRGAIQHAALTLDGLKHARRAALELAGTSVERIYSSDQMRAYQTAGMVGVQLGLPVMTDYRLREMDVGAWEGMLYSQIKAEYTETYERFTTNPLTAVPPRGEAILDVAERMLEVLDDYAQLHAGQRLLVVTHEIPLSTVRCLVRGCTLACMWDNPPMNSATVTMRWPPEVKTNPGEMMVETPDEST